MKSPKETKKKNLRKYIPALRLRYRIILYLLTIVCISILTLQTAMFASFANGEEEFIKLMNGITGTVVCVMVFGLGIQGICSAKKMKTNFITGGN